MRTPFLVVIAGLTISGISFATICPSLDDVVDSQHQTWKIPADWEKVELNGKPTPDMKFMKFYANIDTQQNTVNCYYGTLRYYPQISSLQLKSTYTGPSELTGKWCRTGPQYTWTCPKSQVFHCVDTWSGVENIAHCIW